MLLILLRFFIGLFGLATVIIVPCCAYDTFACLKPEKKLTRHQLMIKNFITATEIISGLTMMVWAIFS